ncbi:hypothetical protein NPIL_183711 [Nephila pilipes]|uniref:Uncharacterized protein n=1 Tax=Nephila pilipes TaxID=299642 RepID=A0A8X6TR91_NEPPI|nr:hypothetical protein NPIL_183711 [Nephila pilipes]
MAQELGRRSASPQWRPTVPSPEVRSLPGVLSFPVKYFNGLGKVSEFIQSVNIILPSINFQMNYINLRNHLKGRARDWYGVIGADTKQGESTDLENTQAALKDAFPVVHDSRLLEAEFYSAKQ